MLVAEGLARVQTHALEGEAHAVPGGRKPTQRAGRAVFAVDFGAGEGQAGRGRSDMAAGGGHVEPQQTSAGAKPGHSRTVRAGGVRGWAQQVAYERVVLGRQWGEAAGAAVEQRKALPVYQQQLRARRAGGQRQQVVGVAGGRVGGQRLPGFGGLAEK